MKKRVLFVFSLALIVASFTACVNNARNSKEPNADSNNPCHFEMYYHSFMQRFPDGLDNDIKKNRMNEQFVAEITDSLKTSTWLLDDYPVRFEGVKIMYNNKCMVHFQSWIKPDGFDFKDYNFNELTFDIVAEMPMDKAEQLVDDKYYIIHGTLIKFIPHYVFEEYSDGLAYTASVGIEREISISSENRINWQLGEMLYKIDLVSDYKN